MVQRMTVDEHDESVLKAYDHERSIVLLPMIRDNMRAEHIFDTSRAHLPRYCAADVPLMSGDGVIDTRVREGPSASKTRTTFMADQR